MKKIQFILMASFVLGTCQLAVLSGAADEPDVKESTIELSNNFDDNSSRLAGQHKGYGLRHLQSTYL